METTIHHDLDSDTTLGGNNASDYVIPSQKAIKSYVDNNTGSTVDQTFDGTSSNAQSGVAIEGELSKYVKLDGGSTSQIISLSSGTGTTPLTLKSKSSSSCYVSYNANGTWVGSLGVNSSKRPTFYNGTTYTLAYTSELPDISTKQDTLVSGTNIKTVNNTSLLGSGNISVGTVTSVNNISPINGDVTLNIPSEVTESTVSDWGFTKNTGTVTSVNNISPVNGNVSLTIPTVNNATLTIQENGTTVKTFTANASTDVTCNITVPTKTSDLTNDNNFITGITSSDVTTALGYTPYNSTNPNGYQANVIETIKVNGTALTPTSKAVDITVPSAVTESTVSSWGFTKNVGTVTSVNNTQPDANGNVNVTVSGGANIDLSNLSSTGEAHFGKVKSVNNTSPDANGNVSITIPDVSNLADNTLSNVSSINANSAVQTALNNKTLVTFRNWS